MSYFGIMESGDGIEPTHGSFAGNRIPTLLPRLDKSIIMA